jgi:hypothetical protein
MLVPTTTKTVKGKRYLYYSYYDSDEQKKKEIYCGGIDTKEAKRKVLEAELEYLKKQKQDLVEKISEIETKLSSIKDKKG